MAPGHFILGLVTFMSVVHVLAPLPFGFAIWLIAIFIERPRLSFQFRNIYVSKDEVLRDREIRKSRF